MAHQPQYVPGPAYSGPPMAQPGAPPYPPVMSAPPMTAGPDGIAQPMKTRPWSSGCCGCFDDCCICLMGYFCPCWLYGQVVEALGRAQGVPAGCCGACCSYCCVGICFACPCLIAPTTRKGVRAKYGIVEEPMDDCWMHWPCCTRCAMCQEARELKAMGVWQ